MILVKIGGGKDLNLEGIVADLAAMEEAYVVVHGANALRDELGEKLGWEKKILTSQSGYSSVFSDEQAIDVLLMAYAGLRNKRLVELFQRSGVNAVGLTGLDGRLVQGRRNSGIRVREGGKTRIVRDFSGKPKAVNRKLLDLLLAGGFVPVLSVPIADEEGFAVNSENDDIVGVLQESFGAETVIHLMAAGGYLEDKGDPDSVVREMSREELVSREEKVEGRMKRKMLAIRRLLEQGAATVVLADGRTEHPVRDALAGKGTVIR